MNGLPAQHDRDVGFRLAEKDDLSEVAVVAQCLDNQWVSPSLLKDMMVRGWRARPVSEPDASRRIEPLLRPLAYDALIDALTSCSSRGSTRSAPWTARKR